MLHFLVAIWSLILVYERHFHCIKPHFHPIDCFIKIVKLVQAVDTVVAGILHDVIDDTCESLHKIEENFGDDVAKLVAGVSRLSYINQVL